MTLVRALDFLVHVIVSGVACLVFAFRRHTPLVFTHFPDIDRTGLDRQMGPLIDRLIETRQRFTEVTLVPLNGSVFRNLSVKRRLFVSYAMIVGFGKILGFGDRERGRVRVAKLLLHVLRPSVMILIDESGSGQWLLRAGKPLRIPSLGIQHGDFQPDNPQYAKTNRAFDIQPADRFAVWSSWFKTRLLWLSPIYDESRLIVSGRMRYPIQDRWRRQPGRVLLVSERSESFHDLVSPFLEILRDTSSFELRIQRHPGEGESRWPKEELSNQALDRSIQEADVVLGRRSSALLEAGFWRRPMVILGPGDPASYSEVADAHCEVPNELLALCRSLCGKEPRFGLTWDDSRNDPAQLILEEARKMARWSES